MKNPDLTPLNGLDVRLKAHNKKYMIQDGEVNEIVNILHPNCQNVLSCGVI